MMKWWGWGDPKISFSIEHKPNLWPWIAKTLDVREMRENPPVSRDSVRMPEPVRNESFLRGLKTALSQNQIAGDEDVRLDHSYGKSYPDLFYARRGIIRRAPDLVVFPESHDEVEKIVALACEHGVSVIPFGGGTNIVGGVNPKETGRMVVTLSLARMNRLLSLDPRSNIAVIEAGSLGPKLEADLQAKGYSLGHFPDSFEFSTLGGWIATRSAGMQSDAYGKIEDMVVALKMVTPQGTLTTRTVPASSAGPDLNRLMAGSEGTLGVITECTMRVHAFPAARDYRGILFPTFEDGLAAIEDCLNSDRHPSLIRLQDTFETELAFNMKAPTTGLKGFIQNQFKKILKARGYHFPAIMILGVEGEKLNVRRTRDEALAIIKKHKGFDLGLEVGAVWQKDKFNLPYLRDFVMDRGILCDVAETSTPWANVLPLYTKVRETMNAKFAADGTPGFIGCHLSHTYKAGACLYFTYACRQQPGRELEQYYALKKLVTETFLKNGAALTHHHAVGTEHRPWMEQEVSKTGLTALRALKSGLDPEGLFNPGKLIPGPEPLAGWAQPTEPNQEGAREPAGTQSR
ncbi:MAG: FAD-binding oxidoreductase [Elusimicrobia bacterium]|nr:FAD-binding oxidoreductase [Elusimicrobiota bacterium]